MNKSKTKTHIAITLLSASLILFEVILLFWYKNYFLSFGSVIFHILGYGALTGKFELKANKYASICTFYVIFLVVRVITYRFETLWLISHLLYLLFIAFLFAEWLKTKPSFIFKIDWKSEYRYQWYFFAGFVIFGVIYTIIDLKELGREYDLLENSITVEARITRINIVTDNEINVDYVYSIDKKKIKRESVMIYRFAGGNKQVGDTLMITVAVEDKNISRIPYEYRDDWKDIIR
jgi:hypothetical protein